MRRKETQKISDILKDFVKRPAYEQKIQETMIVSNWGKVLGPGIAKSTSELYIKNRTLFVRIESPVVRHELFMMRSRIIEALNKSVGSNVIGNIHFS